MTKSRQATNSKWLHTKHLSRLAANLLGIPLMLSHHWASAKIMDGFFAYCTSNLDGTGICVNEEDGREISCLIVPGQIISCPTQLSRSVECVWISGITANQAQFWCNADAEAAMYGNASNSNPTNDLENKYPQTLDDNELQDPAPGSIFEKSF